MSANDYLSVLGKLKFNSQNGSRNDRAPKKESNILKTYTPEFARANPSYEIKVRFLMDGKRMDINPFERHWHTFPSDDGQSGWQTVNCPGYKKCPICEKTHEMWVNGDAITKDEIKKFFRRDDMYMNCYVISNPVAPEQNGTVKVAKLNKQVLEIFNRATTGRDARRFGERILRLDNDGCTFNIVVDMKGRQFPQFDGSYFSDPEDSVADLAGLTEERIGQIYESTFDLSTMFPTTPPEEVAKIVAAHAKILCNRENAVATLPDEEVDNLPFDEPAIPPPPPPPPAPKAVAAPKAPEPAPAAPKEVEKTEEPKANIDPLDGILAGI